MSEVIVNIYDNEDFMYTYQIVDNEEGKYMIWKSTGPIRGHYIGDKEGYENLIDAMDALVRYIKKGEME